MRRSIAPVLLVLALSVAGCGEDVALDDAGIDAGSDGGQDGGQDAGPRCEPACGTAQACCPDGAGGGSCARLATDIENCGACGIDCVATGRGDSCQTSSCACGDFILGCLGTSTSTCCVPPAGGGDPHCANLVRDFRDCGACGSECDPRRASDCDARRCVCGASRTQCAGTDADRCCPDVTGTYACVDTTSDRDHCGECGQRCPGGSTCVAGTCT